MENTMQKFKIGQYLPKLRSTVEWHSLAQFFWLTVCYKWYVLPAFLAQSLITRVMFLIYARCMSLICCYLVYHHHHRHYHHQNCKGAMLRTIVRKCTCTLEK